MDAAGVCKEFKAPPTDTAPRAYLFQLYALGKNNEKDLGWLHFCAGKCTDIINFC